MRGTRWLILLAILAILGASGLLYLHQRTSVARQTPPRPAMLPADTNSTAIDYEYGQSTDGIANFKVKAKGYRQIRDTPNYELTDLELQLMQKDHQHYDLIKSAKAQFNQAENRMYSEGVVEITLDVPVQGPPPHPLTWIRSSGVTFDSKVGKAVTDRPTEFKFENGEGKCVGASYDPSTRELHLLHEPDLNLRGKGPKSKPMNVKAGEITYKEAAQVVLLAPWSKMERAETTIEAGASTVNLKDGQIDSIDAIQAHGRDKYPHREVQYSADLLHVLYGETGEVEKITGTGNARLHSAGEGNTTETRSNAADLDFEPGQGESLLRHVLARGQAVAESKPSPDEHGKTAETRILRSESIDMLMRAGGREIETVKALAPGELEFLPNAPEQHRRVLNGDNMVIGYGAKNAIQSFEAVHVSTLTFPAAATKTRNAAPGKTASVNLKASFDAHGQLTTMKQWDHFTYEEGERRAKAETATLDNPNGIMDLESGARIWDASGATDADRIHMQQKTGDYTADGHVSTSRLPDQDPKKKRSGDMLDGDEPMQGTAPHMTSANHNHLVHYDGGAVLWQGSDRIQGDVIDIDREKHTLTAAGKVTTQFLDETKKSGDDGPARKTASGDATPRIVKASVAEPPAKAAAAPAAAPVYTLVTSDKLVYTDEDRLAHYSGGVVLTRPGLRVSGEELRAFLNPKDSDAESRLNHAFSDRNVEIVDSRLDRQRTGHGEHGEYYTEEDKLVLRGNMATLTDSLKGDSKGPELTYFTADDRLLITGSATEPVHSRLKRKPRGNAHSGNR